MSKLSEKLNEIMKKIGNFDNNKIIIKKITKKSKEFEYKFVYRKKNKKKL